MKIIHYSRHHGGSQHTSTERTETNELTFSDWQRLHGGYFVEHPVRWSPPPEGYFLWRTFRGEVMAIRVD
jgi:hypothetical protein